MSKSKSLPFKEGLVQLAHQLTENGRKPLLTGIPVLPGFRKVESTEEQLRLADEAAEALRKYAADVTAAMDGYVERLWACLAGDEAHREARAGEFKQLAEAIREHISEQTNTSPAARRAAVTSYALALVERCPSVKWAISTTLWGPTLREVETLPGLVDLGMLEEVTLDREDELPKGSFRFLGHVYRTTPSVPEPRLAILIPATLAGKVREAAEEAEDNFKERTKTLLDQTTPGYDFEALLTGKVGKLGFVVPDTKRDSLSLPGGVLLVESDGHNVSVLDAIGHFQRRLGEIRDLKRTLWVTTLRDKDFRAPGLPAPVFRDLRVLHDVVRRGLEAQAKHEARLKEKQAFNQACEAERDLLLKRATLSNEEWFLKGSVGATVICFKKWETDETDYWGVSALLERNEEGKVRLAQVPERLANLFKEPSLFGWTAPGEKFRELKYPLGSMLRTGYGFELANARREEQSKAAQPASTAEVQSA